MYSLGFVILSINCFRVVRNLMYFIISIFSDCSSCFFSISHTVNINIFGYVGAIKRTEINGDNNLELKLFARCADIVYCGLHHYSLHTVISVFEYFG